jgi:hypothetical protein
MNLNIPPSSPNTASSKVLTEAVPEEETTDWLPRDPAPAVLEKSAVCDEISASK